VILILMGLAVEQNCLKMTGTENDLFLITRCSNYILKQLWPIPDLSDTQ